MVYRISGIVFTAALSTALLTTTVTRAAVNGEQQWISDATPAAFAGEVIDQRMSANGRFIVYTRASTEITGGGIGYVWDRTDNSTTLVANPEQVSEFSQADVDNAGNVVFVSGDSLDVIDDNATEDIYHTVPASGVYTLLSRLPQGGVVGNGASQNPRISTDGQYVVFETSATNFSSFNDINGSGSDVYRVNVSSGAVDLVSRAAAVLTPPPVPLVAVVGLTGNGASAAPDISADGRFVVYQSKATDLNRDADSNGAEFDVVLRDMDGERSSAFVAYYIDPAAPENQTHSVSESINPGISEAGDTVVFTTHERLDMANDTNNDPDIYTWNNGVVMLQSIGLNNLALGGSYGKRLEVPGSDGPTVWSTVDVQTTADENLISDIYFNQADAITPFEDVLIELASIGDDANTSTGASSAAILPAVSADGRYISYITSNDGHATLQNDSNGAADVYVFDRGGSYCDIFLEQNQFTIETATWYQLALPCQPPLNSVVADILGDDLPGLPLDTTPGADNTGVLWAAYVFDASQNEYQALTLDSGLDVGTGFWIRQDTGQPITLDMPTNSWQTASTTKFNAACLDAFHGCATLILSQAATPETQVTPRWKMKGNPFGGAVNQNIDNIRVVMTSDDDTIPCQSSTDSEDLAPGCDLNEAFAADVLVPFFYHWNPVTGVYDRLGRTDTIAFGQTISQLQRWQGLWVAELDAASDRQILLVIPEDELVIPILPPPPSQ